MKRMAWPFLSVLLLLATPGFADVQCSVTAQGCVSAAGGGAGESDDLDWTGLHTWSQGVTFNGTPTSATFLSQFLVEQESAPAAPSAALAGAGAGNVDDGTHLYAYTCVDDVGETSIGTASSEFTMVDKSADGKVDLTSIAVCVSGQTASRKVYRTAAGTTTPFKLLTTIADNTTTTYQDNTADAGLGANSPAANTTAVRLSFEGTADGFETRIAVTDPVVDTWFTIGPSPDGNPWLGAGAGDAGGATETDDLCLGENACGAMSGTATDNTCLGDNSCADQTSADFVVALGADVLKAANSGGATVAGARSCDTETDARMTAFGSNIACDANMTAVGQDVQTGASSMVLLGDTVRGYAIGGVGVGYQAEVSDGVSLGYRSGDAQAAADVNNSFGGFESGGAASGTATGNSCWGDLCFTILTSGDRNTAVGANSDVGTNTDSDTTQLGESIVGKNSDSMLLGFGGREGYFIQGLQKTLTESAATATVRISVATESYTGVRIKWRVFADDGTDFQALSGESTIDCVNKATAETCVVRTLPAFGAAVEAASAGTLALDADPTLANNAEGTIDFLLDATSSLTQTTLEALYSVEVVGPATVITPL